MSWRSAAEILAEADRRGLRRAVFVTALMLELEAVREYPTYIGSVSSDEGSI